MIKALAEKIKLCLDFLEKNLLECDLSSGIKRKSRFGFALFFILYFLEVAVYAGKRNNESNGCDAREQADGVDGSADGAFYDASGGV